MKYIIQIDAEPDEIYRVIKRSEYDEYLTWYDKKYPPWKNIVFWADETEDEMFLKYHENTRRQYKHFLEDLKEYHREGMCGNGRNNKIQFGGICSGCKKRYTHDIHNLPEFYYFCPIFYMHKYFNSTISIEQYELGNDSIIFSINVENLPLYKLHDFISEFEYMDIDGINISYKQDDFIVQICPFNRAIIYEIPTFFDKKETLYNFYQKNRHTTCNHIISFPFHTFIMYENVHGSGDENCEFYDFQALKILAPSVVQELLNIYNVYNKSASIIQKWTLRWLKLL